MALPVVLAAAVLKRTIIVHESDVRPGLVNKIAARFAKYVFTGFEKVLPHSNVVGQILSDDILDIDNIDKNGPVYEAMKGIDSSKTAVFVTGGSQGSKRLYLSLIEVLKKNPALQEHLVFFVALGQLNTQLKKSFQGLYNVYTFDFLSQQEMGMMYQTCDIALTRAGTT